eukprot:COSAG02_NODE_1674_length_11381_cov_5.445045_5_plen_132_part_00
MADLFGTSDVIGSPYLQEVLMRHLKEPTTDVEWQCCRAAHDQVVKQVPKELLQWHDASPTTRMRPKNRLEWVRTLLADRVVPSIPHSLSMASSLLPNLDSERPTPGARVGCSGVEVSQGGARTRGRATECY